jgi:uncharacterized membrane protein
MILRRTTIIGLAATGLAAATAVALYPRLPETIPAHWNIHGAVDGTMPKAWGIFFYPGLIAFIAVLATAIPAISPQGFRIERFARAYDLIMTSLIIFFLCLMAAAFTAALGFPVPMTRIVIAGAGALLIAIGNVMGKVTRNFFVGIRTPWTLASGEVWSRTHRLAGRLLVAGGLGILATTAFDVNPVLPLIGIVGATVVIPIAYSYVIYRRLDRTGTNDAEI